ncbi:hypothetical protein EJB05_40088, partial [Eragrostis curvula]
MASPQESNSLCLKRKLVEDCQSKEFKSRRIEAENGPSFDSSAERCNCCRSCPNLANDCFNFLKSGVPSRIMYYKQGSWHSFPEQVMKSLIEECRGNKSSAVAVMDNEPILVDFLAMTLVNLKSRKQRSVAWFDGTGKCYLPSMFFDEETSDTVKGDAAMIEGTSQGIMLNKVVNSSPEVVKQVAKESCPPPDPQKPCIADILRKRITPVNRDSGDFLFVQDLFLSGMGPFATPKDLLHVYRYSPNDITERRGLEAFERQVMLTKEEHGDANVRYGWLGSRKNDIVRILVNGLGTTRKPVEKSGLSAGVYLSPENRAFTSVGLCDVDEKGVQYMFLCRVILGKMEAIKPGSQESFPSNKMCDSGVDDCSNPKCYVMWPSHLSTHIRLEYLISFKIAPLFQNYLLGLKDLWFHPSPAQLAADISTRKPVTCETDQGPTTPWVSFEVLFGEIQDKISSVARELLFHHDEELKESKITREEMVKKMVIIVGEKILSEALEKLQQCPSLWFKPSVEAASSDPARTATEQLSLDKAGRDCLITLSGDHDDDSHAPSAMVEHSTVLIPKGYSALDTDILPKGHDGLAPSCLPETSSSAGSILSNFQGAVTEGRESTWQIMSPGNTATQCAKKHDSLVAKLPPIVREGLLMSSGRSASPGVEACTPPAATESLGCDSSAPSGASRGHGSSASALPAGSEGCESSVPSLTLGNSESTHMRRLSSKPRMTFERQGFLSLGIASQGSAFHPVKGPDGIKSVPIPPVHAPGKASGIDSSPCIACVSERLFVAYQMLIVEVAISFAGSRNSPLIISEDSVSDALALSLMPKGNDPPSLRFISGNDPPASSKEPKHRGSSIADMMPQGNNHQARGAATMVHSAFTSRLGNSLLISTEGSDALALRMMTKGNDPPASSNITVEPNQVVLSGAQNNVPVPLHVIQAADILMAMSTAREEGGP